MKDYVLYLILFMCCSCGSSKRSSNTSYSVDSRETKKEVQRESIQNEQLSEWNSKTETTTHIEEEITLVTYDTESGNVQSVQKTRRTTGQNQLGDSTKSGSDVSRIEKQSEAASETDTDIKAEEQTQTEKDTRPVQGWKEWGIITLIVSFIIGLYIWLKRRKR